MRVLNVSHNLLSGVVPEALQSSGMFQLVRRPITDILHVLRYIICVLRYLSALIMPLSACLPSTYSVLFPHTVNDLHALLFGVTCCAWLRLQPARTVCGKAQTHLLDLAGNQLKGASCSADVSALQAQIMVVYPSC